MFEALGEYEYIHNHCQKKEARWKRTKAVHACAALVQRGAQMPPLVQQRITEAKALDTELNTVDSAEDD